MKLTSIGYWRDSENDPRWPDPQSFVDSTWDQDERRSVAHYLFRGTAVHFFMGYSSCRFCGKLNGNCDYSDGVYIWPEGLAHYVEEHGVRLPHAFVAYALKRLNDLQEAESSDAWWCMQKDWAGT